MLQTEFIKNLQSNYERIHLEEKPDDRRYQYCILTRGGIKGLLPCSLRYINGQAYLYYDITSKQNTAQFCAKQIIDRKWVRNLFLGLKQLKKELERFLLDDKNILLYPDQIFQDVGNRNFFFLYLPYNKEESGARKLIEFLLEHMDYEDEKLVECIYTMYEKIESMGEPYLQERIFEDIERLGEEPDLTQQEQGALDQAGAGLEKTGDSFGISNAAAGTQEEEQYGKAALEAGAEPVKKAEKGFLWRILNGNGKKKKADEEKNLYRESMWRNMEGMAVAEDTVYEADYGQTIYEEQPAEEEMIHKLYTPDGRIAAVLKPDSFLIGKQKDEVDLVLEDSSVSRVHARIYKEEDLVYIEDLNSTNGTFKNGLRMQPYEKRRLEEDDEIRFGKLLFVYR